MELVQGNNYLVETVNKYWLGELVSSDGPYTVTLRKVSWIADTGRFSDFMKNGRADNMEVEPQSDDMLKKLQWLSIDEWPHKLLRKREPE